MGFADGVPRAWYENGYVSYNGITIILQEDLYGPIYGGFWRLKPELGDEVLVFGKRKNDFIPVETIAKKIPTTYVF